MDYSAAISNPRKRSLDNSSEARPPKKMKGNTVLDNYFMENWIDRTDNLQYLEGVREVDIQETDLITKRDAFCSSIQKVDSIQEVKFEETRFNTAALTMLMTSFSIQRNLTRLDLISCNLDDKHAQIIFEFAHKKESLIILKLSDNRIQLEEDWIVNYLASCSLATLDLGGNLIDDTGESFLAEALKANKSIKKLYLNGNTFSGGRICMALKINRTLEMLDLQGAINGRSFVHFALIPLVKVNRTLKVINLNDAKIVDQEDFEVDYIGLVRALRENTTLIYISLRGVDFPIEFIRELHGYFRNLQKLKGISRYEERMIDHCTPDTIQSDDSESSSEFESEYYFVGTQAYVSKRQSLEILQSSLLQLNTEQMMTDEKCQRLTQRREDMRKEIQALQTTIKELSEKIKDMNRRLPSPTDIGLAEVKALSQSLEIFRNKHEIDKLEAELAPQEQRVIRLNEKIKSNPIQNWTVADVAEFMIDIDAPKEAIDGVKQNCINGQILQCLTTPDITHTFNMSFCEAKRLQTYVLLLKCQKDIFEGFTGVLAWTSMEVTEWLSRKGLHSLCSAFRTNIITGQELLTIDSHDLASEEFNGPTLSVKATFERAVQQLRREHDPFQEFRQHDETYTKDSKKVLVKPDLKKKPPSALICPLTKELMKNPVQLSDGHTYEQTAIEEWLVGNDTSPVTHQILISKQIVPSFTVKAMIDEFNNQ